MKNKNGFTLVELLAVIVLLAILTVIAVPSSIAISKKIKDNLYENKVKLILQDAKLYGEDNKNVISNSTKKYNSYPCQNITVNDLLNEGYIDEDDSQKGIVDPRDNTSMNNKKIIIYIKYNRITTTTDGTCS